MHKLIKQCQCPDGYVATRIMEDDGDGAGGGGGGILMDNNFNFDMQCKKDGGVLGGGYLLGLIAFARKFARCILTLTMLIGIVCVTFYFCSMSRESPSAITTTSALVHVTEAEYTITSLNWDSP
ncbi:uncharacterized protein LOC135953753 [Calliphora vicina]|uniref:uncharacterized protein LOC135953753 n=1 Tax=Calliphora vicina TaxID=7373 RepID=UPI00325C2B75